MVRKVVSDFKDIYLHQDSKTVKQIGKDKGLSYTVYKTKKGTVSIDNSLMYSDRFGSICASIRVDAKPYYGIISLMFAKSDNDLYVKDDSIYFDIVDGKYAYSIHYLYVTKTKYDISKYKNVKNYLESEIIDQAVVRRK